MLNKQELTSLKKEVNSLNKEVEGKSEVDFNELLSYLYRKGISKGLSNSDVRNGRVENVEKKISKLHAQFRGFRVKVEDDTYKSASVYQDILLIGEILGLEYAAGLYHQKYIFLKNAPLPLYFGWYGKSAVVHMKATRTEHPTMIPFDLENLDKNLPTDVLGKQSEFTLNGDSIDPELDGTLLLFFAEGAIPKDVALEPIKSLVKLITDQIQNTYNPQPENKVEETATV
jgi:hypothetical protein